MEDKKYTDEQLKHATQIAYLGLIEDTYVNLKADGKKGPFTLKQLIIENVDTVAAAKQLNDIDSASIKELIEYSELSAFDKNIINNLSDETLNWKIVDIHDKNDDSGLYSCVIETSPNRAIVAFRGSESFDNYTGLVNDWVKSDFGLFNNKQTPQQQEVENYLDQLSTNGVMDKYDFLAATGHSLGGNLASHFAIASAIGDNRKEIFDKLNQVINFDGPGNSKEYLKYYEDAIKKACSKIIHYQWSLVGTALNNIPGENTEFLAIDENEYKNNLLEKFKYKTVGRHATTSIIFGEDGQAIRGKQDKLSKFMHNVSIGAENIPIKLIGDVLVPDKIQNVFGLCAAAIKKSVYQKEDGTIGFRLFAGNTPKNINPNRFISGMIKKMNSDGVESYINDDVIDVVHKNVNNLEVGKSGYEDVTDAIGKGVVVCDINGIIKEVESYKGALETNIVKNKTR